MNRRDAIRSMSLSLGITVAVPTILSVLNSCNDPKSKWTSVFLSDSQKHIISHLIEIMLPNSNFQGETGFNNVQFIDKMVGNTLEEKDQDQFSTGCSSFEHKFNSVFKKDITEGTKAEINTLLDAYFKLSKAEEKEVFNQLEFGIHELPEHKVSHYLIYTFLTKVRYYCLLGHFTSQEVLMNYQNYNPNLGYYKGCIDL